MKETFVWAFRWLCYLVMPWLGVGLYFSNIHGGLGGIYFGVALLMMWPLLFVGSLAGSLYFWVWIIGLLLSALWLFALLSLGRTGFQMWVRARGARSLR